MDGSIKMIMWMDGRNEEDSCGFYNFSERVKAIHLRVVNMTKILLIMKIVGTTGKKKG